MMLKEIPWYEQYANLNQYLKADTDCICLGQSISFLNEHLDVTIKDLPPVYAFMWMLKSRESILHHMEERFDQIAANDIIAFSLFTEALLKIKGRVEISKTRYIALFTVFQYLLGCNIANDARMGNVKLFDFDSYNTIYAKLKGEKLPD